MTDAFKVFLYNGKLTATTHNGAYTELVSGNRGIQSGNNITEITNSDNYEYMAITTGSRASYSASTSVTVNINKLMVSTSSDTSYEPYTGGEPAPNPKYPYAIKNTGDNGSVNEKVQNKNLFDESILEQYKVDEDDEAYIFNNQTLFNKNLTPNVKFKEKTAYTIQYIAKQTTGNSRLSIVYTDGTVDDKPYVISTSYTLITLTSNENKTIDYISEVYGLGATKGFYIKKNSVQIEQGSTATSYVPHSEQNISFPLAQGQKLMQGDYLADDEKVHHKRLHEVLDGINKKVISVGSYNNKYYAVYNLEDTSFNEASKNKLLCTHLILSPNNSTKEGYCYITGNGTKFVMTLTDQSLTTVQSVNEWLAEQYANGTPVTIQYELAEEQTEDFTEEQKTAWEEIKKARTYKNVTHISSEDETPANVEIEYVQDNRTLYEDLKSAIISLGGNV